ncbi:MAG: ankyrin repeat domain-containing protein [Planctomycetota bacterium]|jgi:ankyrin repeat protein
MRFLPPVLLLSCLFFVSLHAEEIHDAARDGDAARINSILEKDPKLLNLRNERDATALHFACDGGHVGIVEMLIEKGADLHALDVDGDTPLHWAAYAGFPDAAALLIEHGADINSRNTNDNTPLHYAALKGKPKAAMLLIEKGADLEAKNYEGETPLIWAALRNEKAICSLLIEKGADLENRNDYLRTPLLLVARETGNADMAKFLLDHGADIDACDRYDDTPISLAAWRGFNELLDLLIDRGAAFDAKGPKGREMLMYACFRKLDRLFDLLVKKGASLDIRNQRDGSLLHSAAYGGSTKIVKILLDKGLPVNEKDRYGWTPLHYAAKKGRLEAAEMLADSVADLDARTLSGRTPYNLAVQWKQKEVAKLLASKGADCKAPIFPKLSGEYMGQKKPGTEPEVFALDIVSSSDGEHGCICFSPDGSEAYWSSFFLIQESGYSNAGIFASRIEDGRWTPPEFVFAPEGKQYEGDVPFYAPDGKRIYFISRRPVRPGGPSGKENFWYAERNGKGWGEPKPVSPEVNNHDVHWQFSVSRNGTLYFCSGQAGICTSRLVDGKHAAPVPLSKQSGIDLSGGTPFIAPDESYLLFTSDRKGGIGGGDLYVTFKDAGDRWTEPMNLGPTINTPSVELCPIVSPDGKFLFFLSRQNGRSNVYWVDAGIIDKLRKEALNT